MDCWSSKIWLNIEYLGAHPSVCSLCHHSFWMDKTAVNCWFIKCPQSLAHSRKSYVQLLCSLLLIEEFSYRYVIQCVNNQGERISCLSGLGGIWCLLSITNTGVDRSSLLTYGTELPATFSIYSQVGGASKFEDLDEGHFPAAIMFLLVHVKRIDPRCRILTPGLIKWHPKWNQICRICKKNY